MILNYVACVPVLLSVGGFRCVFDYFSYLRSCRSDDTFCWQYLPCNIPPPKYHHHRGLGERQSCYNGAPWKDSRGKCKQSLASIPPDQFARLNSPTFVPFLNTIPLILSLSHLQNLGRRRNLESILGTNPWLWCWPTVTPGTGLKYDLAENEGEWLELSTFTKRAREQYESGKYA